MAGSPQDLASASQPTGRAAINVDTVGLHALLDDLDRRDDSSSGVPQRRAVRYRYRGSTIVELPGPVIIRQTVTCRNISQLGIAFMMTRFVYPGTLCRIRLVSHLNQDAIVTGKIVRCQYVPGTLRLHEVGAQFDAPIDVELFSTDASQARVLLIDDDPRHAEVLAALLRPQGIRVIVACTLEEATRLTINSNFDLVVIARNVRRTDGPCHARQLRQGGIVTPLVTVADDEPGAPEEADDCEHCNECRVLRLANNGVKQLVQLTRREPVTSSFAGDPALREAINTFVAQLQGWLNDLRAAVNAGDAVKANGIVRSMAVVAEGVGFDLISEQAQAVAQILAATNDVNTARQAISHLALRALAARPVGFAPAGDGTDHPEAAFRA